MDYEGEQSMELEALEAILMDDMEEFEGSNPSGWTSHGKTYIITIRPADLEGDEGETDVEMELIFAHTPSYPDEAPCIRLRSVMGLDDASIAEATRLLNEQIEECTGMAMIYNLVTAAQEWIGTRQTAPAAGAVDEEAEERRRRDEEEAKRSAARAHGHPVTVEAFNAWRKRFDAEMAMRKAQVAETSKSAEDVRNSRLTGRAWFMKEAAEGADASEVEDEVLSSETEIDQEELDSEERHQIRDEEEDEEDDIDYEDDDDDGMLDEYLSGKQ